MKVDFECKECAELREVSYAVSEGPPKDVTCSKGHKMKRKWGKPSVQVPEWFGDDLDTTIYQKMADAALPTGKKQVYY
jgi:hypothetical protein